MIRKFPYLFSILGASLAFLAIGCSSPEGIKEKIWYTSPADEWKEALPIGNGRLGAMVFGGVAEDRIQLNEESLWAGCPEEPFPKNVREHYAKFRELNLKGDYEEALDYAMANLTTNPTAFRSYEPLGDLLVSFNQDMFDDYSRELDMERGLVTTTYEIDGNRFMRECFASVEYDVVMYHFESLDKVPVNASVRFERPKDIKIYSGDNLLFVEGQIIDDPEAYDDNPGGSGKGGEHMKFSSHIGARLENGDLDLADNMIEIANTTEFTVIVSAATDYNPDLMDFDRGIDPEKISHEILSKALNEPFDKIRSGHIKKHSSVFNRVDLQITDLHEDTIPTDRRLQQVIEGGQDDFLTQVLFQYGRYMLMASSGGNARLPANLQGIWNKDMWAAWEADYHLNINLQMNYWPADVCNLSETMAPLSDFMKNLSERGKVTADSLIGSDGWMAHHCANPFGRTTACGSTGGSQVHNGYSFPLAGAWMSVTLWRHYLFTLDEQYLRETAWPVVSGAARFILDFLIEDENGMLVTAPSVSPENMYINPRTGKPAKNTVGAAVDIQIIRDVFEACLEAEKILSENELTREILEALPGLPGIKIGANGTIQEWIEDYEEVEPGHRHISHLYALHPSNQITVSNPDLWLAAEKTLERRLSSGGGQTGWSRAWMINFFARLKKGDQCLHHVNQFIAHHLWPNLFDTHPPDIFQIDGNFGFTAGIAEMLLQSHEPGVIRLLPALPEEWDNGSVTGLKARENYTVDIHWKNGKVIKGSITALNGGEFTLVYEDQTIPVMLDEGEKYSFEKN